MPAFKLAVVIFAIEVKPRGLSHSCDSGRGLRYHRCRRPGLNLYYVPGNYIIRPVSEKYAKNAGAVFSLKYHLVWCPKYRRPVLVKPPEGSAATEGHGTGHGGTRTGS